MKKTMYQIFSTVYALTDEQIALLKELDKDQMLKDHPKEIQVFGLDKSGNPPPKCQGVGRSARAFGKPHK